MGILIGPAAREFIWASGIENTFVPQSRPGHRALDEYKLIGHYEHWREDLSLARDLGLQALRWGVPWYRVEPFPGEFDWRWTDQVLPYLVQELGITPIIDLMHYGCPFWLYKEFVNREYPQAVASYAGAFARRYQGLIKWYTPLNEPLINSLMCGRRALWPPYLRGDRGYIRLMLQLIKGILNTVETIKEIDGQAVMVHVEAAGLSRAIREDLEALALEDQHRGYLSYDLLTGRVTPDHPLFTWLVRNGAAADDLAEFVRRRIPLDIIGLNFYPQWSTKQLYLDQKGRLAYRHVDQDGAGFSTLISDYYGRYQRPIMVTETSAFGPHEVRLRWLEASLLAIKNLRASGIPVHGYTWFPLFTMIDWRYRFGRGPVEEYLLELGLYQLSTGGQRWRETPLVEQMRRYIAQPDDVVGPLKTDRG
jgi:beta-glucosidase/6-phospho-beta-glucosidase/beta-galactosidase